MGKGPSGRGDALPSQELITSLQQVAVMVPPKETAPGSERRPTWKPIIPYELQRRLPRKVDLTHGQL